MARRLRDDDLLTSLRMAAPVPAHGAHRPGGGTDVHLGSGVSDPIGRMVTEHESTHLELNLLTAYGGLLRALGHAAETSPVAAERLAVMVGRCRNTHEVVATTLGVWRSTTDHEGALADYPAYARFLEAGRTLAGSLRAGSFAAETAVAAASWVAMQAPIGAILRRHVGADVPPEALPRELWPDERLSVLLRSGVDPGALEVEMPASWREQLDLLAGGERSVSDAGFQTVATAYYASFARVLEEAGMPTLPYDGHMTDPDLQAWAATLDPRAGGRIGGRPDADGLDRFWRLSLTDAERVVRHRDRILLPMRLSELPERGDERTLGRDDLVQGPDGDTSLLLVVRPLRTILRQYRVSREGEELLRSTAIDGVVTAVRADLRTSSGFITLFVVVSSREEVVELLATTTSRHGLLASLSSMCAAFPRWERHWAPILEDVAYAVALADYPRRGWIEWLSEQRDVPACSLLTFGPEDAPELYGLALDFSPGLDPADLPHLALGSRTTIERMLAGIVSVTGTERIVADGLPSPAAAFAALAHRVVAGEPWFDARSIDDLDLDLLAVDAAQS